MEHLQRGDFLFGAAVVIGEHFEGDAVDLFGEPDALVEFGLVQGQTAVGGEQLERLLVLLGEGSVTLVDHLHHAEDPALDEDGHAQDRARPVTRPQIHGSVEAGVGVSVRDVQYLSSSPTIRISVNYQRSTAPLHDKAEVRGPGPTGADYLSG